MTQAAVTSAVRLRQINLRRTRLFGSSSLKIYSNTPAAGETLEATFAKDWFAHRVVDTTGMGTKSADATSWQFQVIADAAWKVSQAFMKKATVLGVGEGTYEEKWKVTKVEKPVGNSLVWKVKAQQIQ